MGEGVRQVWETWVGKTEGLRCRLGRVLRCYLLDCYSENRATFPDISLPSTAAGIPKGYVNPKQRFEHRPAC